MITNFAEIELSAGNEKESVSSFLQENGKECIVADRPSTERIPTDLGKMHYGDKNVITNFAEIELSAGNEEEPVSGHSVLVYADEEISSSKIGKIHLSLAYFDVVS